MKRILVVEDEASIRELVALNLKMTGWEVLEAPSAERARTNRDGSGWMVCNREGTTVYCELRLTDPAKETQTPDIDGEQTEAGEYRRIANIGSQQLQARVVTPYYGLSIDDIIHGTTVFR